jgi:hypothetical protein
VPEIHVAAKSQEVLVTVVFRRIAPMLMGLALAVATLVIPPMPHPGAPSAAYAQEDECVLVGAQGGRLNSPLFILNPDTGAVIEATAPKGFAITGLSVDPVTGELFGVTSRQSPNNPGHLIRFTTNGSATVVGDLSPTGAGADEASPDLTFRADGDAFAWLTRTSGGTNRLVSINTATGLATVVGTSTVVPVGGGLDFSPGDTLYFTPSSTGGDLRTVDPADGSTTVVAALSGAPPGTNSIAALAFDPSGTLFGVAIDDTSPNPAFLVTIDTTTGTITTRGQSVNRLDAIEWVCDAELIEALLTETAAEANDPENDDKEDEDDKPKETEEQRQQRERTNRGGRGDVSTEGNVLAVEESSALQSLLVTIGVTRDERIVVQVPCVMKSGQLACPDIRVGDYLEADGYQNGVGDPNTHFVASDGIEVWRHGKKVK